MVKKGSRCVTLCCKKSHIAKFDFEPTNYMYSLATDTVYLRGPCFPCRFTNEMVPALAKKGIVICKPSQTD